MWKLSEITFSINYTLYGKKKKNDRKMLFIVSNGMENMTKKLLKIVYFCLVLVF